MYRVLLVDDESIAQIGMRTIVDWEKLGYQIVATASNGEEALQRVGEYQPHLVVSDLVMPGMDGLEMTERLRDEGYEGEIVIISNYSDLNVVKRLLRLGVEDYLLKISCQKNEFEALLTRVREKLDAGGKKAASATDQAKRQTRKNERLKAFLLDSFSKEPPPESGGACYQLFYVRILSAEGIHPNKWDRVRKTMETVLPEAMKRGEGPCFLPMGDAEFAIAADSGAVPLEEGHGLDRKLQRALKLYLMLESSVLYLDNLASPPALRKALLCCQKNIRLSFYAPVCGRADRYPVSSLGDLFHSVVAGNRYKRYLAEHRMETLNEELSMVLHNFEDKRVDPEEALDFLAGTILISAAYLYDHYGKELSRDYGAEIRACRSVQAAREIQARCFDEISREIRQAEEEERQHEPIDRILAYIETNLDSKLTLSDVARYVNLHPNYVSTYFKQKMGRTLSSFITEKKMLRARELLSTQQYKVKEVASLVGIDDAFYFNRLFRKEFGVSPSQYVQSSES